MDTKEGGTVCIAEVTVAGKPDGPNGVKNPPRDGVITGVIAGGTSSTKSKSKSKLDFFGFDDSVDLVSVFSGCFSFVSDSSDSLLSLALSSDDVSVSLSSDPLEDFLFFSLPSPRYGG